MKNLKLKKVDIIIGILVALASFAGGATIPGTLILFGIGCVFRPSLIKVSMMQTAITAKIK